MRFSRVLSAGVAAAAIVAATLLVYLENSGNHDAAQAPVAKHVSAPQRLADDGGDQGDGDTEDPPLQPSELQEEQQEEQQGGPGHRDVRLP